MCLNVARTTPWCSCWAGRRGRRGWSGLTIIPDTMLEAVAMRAFPVQSDTGATAEWIDDGVNGLLVPPEDPAAAEAALRRALADSALVEAAAVENARRTRERMNLAVVAPRVRAMYERVDQGVDRQPQTADCRPET